MPVAPRDRLRPGGVVLDSLDPGPSRFTPQQLSRWEAVTTDPWVVKTLSEGYRIQFRRRPPPFNGVRMTVVGDPLRSQALSKEIEELLGKGAVECVPGAAQLRGYYSFYFLVPKKDGGFRPILDLRKLNQFLKVFRFRMLRTVDVLQSVSAGDWFTCIDLKDAYFHVPVAPDHRQFLRFAFKGQVYQFRVLPFGLSLSPRVFTRCVAAALHPLQAGGMRILPYLDDWLLCASSRERALDITSTLLEHVAQLGLTVNFKKSSLVPRQDVVFIGVAMDSVSMRARPSPRRVDDILELVPRVRGGAGLTYGLLLRLLGMLIAASTLVPLGLLSLRPLQVWVNALGLDPERHQRRPVRLSSQCCRLLEPWGRRRFLCQGVALGSLPSHREIVVTDASLTGWGAVWDHRSLRGSWSPRESLLHMNTLELRAVHLALRGFLPALEGSHILVRTDNTSAVYHINHQGGVRSQQSLREAQRLLQWAFPRFATLRAMHLPGVENQVADLLSRGRPPPGEWRLNPSVVLEVWERFGRAEVDLFASEASTHCPQWFSLSEPSSPLGQDALAHPWPRGLLYAFPPLPLLTLTLHRIATDGHTVLLVAPYWPGRVWFPRIQHLLNGTPWPLPSSRDLLSQVGGRLWHPHPDRLRLHVWPLRGRTPC